MIPVRISTPIHGRRLAITTYPAFVRCSRYCKAWRRQIGQVILARLLRDVRNAFVRHPCAREGLLGQNFDLRYPRAVKRGRRKRGGEKKAWHAVAACSMECA